MNSPVPQDLQFLTERLEKEARLFFNISANDYLGSLRFTPPVLPPLQLPSFIDTTDVDNKSGIVWLVAVPLIYFISVFLFLVVVVGIYTASEKHSEKKGTRGEHSEQDTQNDMTGRNRMNESIPMSELNKRQHEACSSKTLPSNFLRGYIDAGGEVKCPTRASAESKGSVRSLGVLTRLDIDGQCRPTLQHLGPFHSITPFHPNPPSAPVVPPRGMEMFHLPSSKRISRSFDELRRDTCRIVPPSSALVPDWSGLGARGGRTSLEMNVTSGSTRLTLYESRGKVQQSPSDSKPEFRDEDVLRCHQDDRLSRDSLRTSMDLHKETSLHADDMYEELKSLQGRSLPKTSKNGQRLVHCKGSSSSNSDGVTNLTDAGVNDLSHINSDSDNNSHCYTRIHSYTIPNAITKLNIEHKYAPLRKPKGVNENRFPSGKECHKCGCHNTDKLNDAIMRGSSYQNDSERIANQTRHTRHNDEFILQTKNTSALARSKGSIDYIDLFQADSYLRSSTPQNKNKSMSSPESSPKRPLSLDMLSSDYTSIPNKAKRPVGRELFATTPQVSQAREGTPGVDPSSKSTQYKTSNKKTYLPKTTKDDVVSIVDLGPGLGKARYFLDYSSSDSEIAPISINPVVPVKPARSKYNSQHGKPISSTLHNPASLGSGNNWSLYDGNRSQNSVTRAHIPSTQQSLPSSQNESECKDISGLSTAASIWTSATQSSTDLQGKHQDEWEESAQDSSGISLPSSILPFHAKLLEGQDLVHSCYPLPKATKPNTQATNPKRATYTIDEDVVFDMNLSLGPNLGSSIESSEKGACSAFADDEGSSQISEPAIVKPNRQSSHMTQTTVTQTHGHVIHKPPRARKVSNTGDLVTMARNIFKHQPSGLSPSPAKSYSSKESSIAEETSSQTQHRSRKNKRGKETKKRGGFSVEKRLLEFGFIKKLSSGGGTFVVNPSPGKFSERNSQANVNQTDSPNCERGAQLESDSRRLTWLLSPRNQKTTLSQSRSAADRSLTEDNCNELAGICTDHDISGLNRTASCTMTENVEQSRGDMCPERDACDGNIISQTKDSVLDKSELVKDGNNNESPARLSVSLPVQELSPNVSPSGEPRVSVRAIRERFQQSWQKGKNV